MAFKSINHDDEKIFYNRLWKLMEERNLSTARELAQALYAEEIVPVDSASEDEIIYNRKYDTQNTGTLKFRRYR